MSHKKEILVNDEGGEGSVADEDDDLQANCKMHPTAEPGYQTLPGRNYLVYVFMYKR